jgi:hypothetical protein
LQLITISRSSSNKALCVCRLLESCQIVYQFEFIVRRTPVIPNAIISCDSAYLILSGIKPPKQREDTISQSSDVLIVKRLDNGDMIATTRPKYPDYRLLIYILLRLINSLSFSNTDFSMHGKSTHGFLAVQWSMVWMSF